MSYYPIMIDLEGKKVLVIGGGKVATRKVETFLEYGAEVRVVSKDLEPELRNHVENGDVRYSAREFHEDDLADIYLIITATNNKNLNHEISIMAREKGILVNAVDQPTDCSFIVPSILKRGDLIIAVSTSGKSPALAKKVKKNYPKDLGTCMKIFY